jgi:hypothetical protein
MIKSSTLMIYDLSGKVDIIKVAELSKSNTINTVAMEQRHIYHTNTIVITNSINKKLTIN